MYSCYVYQDPSSSILPFNFHGIRDEFYDFVRYFVSFSDNPNLQDYIIDLFVINPYHNDIFRLVLVSFKNVLVYIW